jgi:uncharacterized membrane protein YcjF (UPF0283 family)
MQELVRADLFFAISATAVIVITVAVVVVLIYLFNIVRDVRRITKLAKDESELLAEDMKVIHEQARRGAAAKGLVAFIAAVIKRRRTKKKKDINS